VAGSAVEKKEANGESDERSCEVLEEAVNKGLREFFGWPGGWWDAGRLTGSGELTTIEI
jgi:hypothetical protein